MFFPKKSKLKPVALSSNLRNFIDSVTPTVNLSLHNKSDEKVESFLLADLWEVYEEWSACGVGVPIRLKNSKIVTQYYAPFLSGIQIFTNKPTQLKCRNNGDEVDELLESESDNLSRSSSSNDSSKAWDDIFDNGNDKDDMSGLKDPCEHLYLEFFDNSSPYHRAPILDKVVELNPKNRGLYYLRNTDLAPGSWMSVAWYPICHIPSKGRIKELDSACFLTFHTLSASFQEEDLVIGKPKVKGETGGKTNAGGKRLGSSISLRPFGLVTYRMTRDFWLKDASDCKKMVHLYSAADSWLKQLEVTRHHDFSFFTRHSPLDVLHRTF